MSDDSVVLGIGDDGAITRLAAGQELVTVIDTMVEDVHFPARLDPADIGFRAVAVNLSDIAAMGARPRWMTLALTLGKFEETWLQSFAGGLFEAAKAHDVVLIGGDTTRGSGTVVTVQLSGELPVGESLRRCGAADGDDIYVSGSLGDAAAGLQFALNGPLSQSQQFLRARFLRPTARIALGEALRNVASAAIDVSDGLFADLSRILEQSRVGGALDIERLPLAPALIAECGRDGAIELALSGGDDYELCFTVESAARNTVDAIATQCDTALTRIGTVRAQPGLACLLDGVDTGYHDAGFRHFR